MNALPVGIPAHAQSLALARVPVPVDQVVAGSPSTGSTALGDLGDGIEIGVWEMTPGAATDTELDEVFVVLSGRARIEFLASAIPSIEVGPGDVIRLTVGLQTVWTVTETLRKVYLAR